MRVLRRLPIFREELTRGIGVNVLFIGGQAAITLLATVLAARYLGPEGVGIVAIGLLIAEIVSVYDNLASPAFVRDMAGEPLPSKIATVLGTKAILGASATLVLVVLSPFIADLFEVPLSIPLTFAFIPTASIVSSVALMTWESQRDMVRRNATPLAEAVARLAAYSVVALGIALPFSRETSIALATLLASAFASVVGVALIPSLSVRQFDGRKAIEYIRFGLRAQTTGALQKILFWFDIVLIDLYLGHEIQGLYKTAYTLMAYVSLATGAVAIMMYPTIARALAAGDPEKARHTFSLGAFACLALGAPFVVLFVTIPEAILGLLMGGAFVEAAWMLRGLGALGVLAMLLVPFETYFPAIGRPDLGLRIAAFEVVTNVVLNLVLVPRIGVAGAIIATGVSFALGLGVAVWTLRALGHELPRVSDVTRLLRHPPAHPPQEPPML